MGIYDRDWWKDRNRAPRAVSRSPRRARAGRAGLLAIILFWLALAGAFWLLFGRLGY